MHNRVLKPLAASLETRQTSINALPPPLYLLAAVSEFEGEGEKKVKVKTPETGQLDGVCDWKLSAYLNQRLCFPSEIVYLRPDLVLWSSSLRTVYISLLCPGRMLWRWPMNARALSMLS